MFININIWLSESIKQNDKSYIKELCLWFFSKTTFFSSVSKVDFVHNQTLWTMGKKLASYANILSPPSFFPGPQENSASWQEDYELTTVKKMAGDENFWIISMASNNLKSRTPWPKISLFAAAYSNQGFRDFVWIHWQRILKNVLLCRASTFSKGLLLLSICGAN